MCRIRIIVGSRHHEMVKRTRWSQFLGQNSWKIFVVPFPPFINNRPTNDQDADCRHINSDWFEIGQQQLPPENEEKQLVADRAHNPEHTKDAAGSRRLVGTGRTLDRYIGSDEKGEHEKKADFPIACRCHTDKKWILPECRDGSKKGKGDDRNCQSNEPTSGRQSLG